MPQHTESEIKKNKNPQKKQSVFAKALAKVSLRKKVKKKKIKLKKPGEKSLAEKINFGGQFKPKK